MQFPLNEYIVVLLTQLEVSHEQVPNKMEGFLKKSWGSHKTKQSFKGKEGES